MFCDVECQNEYRLDMTEETEAPVLVNRDSVPQSIITETRSGGMALVEWYDYSVHRGYCPQCGEDMNKEE